MFDIMKFGSSFSSGGKLNGFDVMLMQEAEDKQKKEKEDNSSYNSTKEPFEF
jgi:hypothetical protein